MEETKDTSAFEEPEPEEDRPKTERGRYQLLDRLFRFVESTEIPLNSVLAGYFSNLTQTLISRRQKLILPYVFQGEN